MSNLQEIKRRINTIGNIEHVTDAIQKIAAARLFKAKNRALNLRNFVNAQADLLNNFSNFRNHKFIKNNDSQETLIIVITPDKGLCGGFSNNIINKTLEFIKDKDKDKITFIIAGKKGVNFFDKRNFNVILRRINIPIFCDMKEIYEIGNILMDLYKEKAIKEAFIIYTEFASMANHTPIIKKLLPLEINTQSKNDPNIYEPDPEIILDVLIPRYVKTLIWLGFLESIASEQAARMIMMERSTKNAKDMIDDLVALRNKSRQSMITKELSEIVSTTEALNK
jgi:F-type H+-transporting ATPase subunit gamma